MNTQNLLDTYYQGLARREGWTETLTEDFRFIGRLAELRIFFDTANFDRLVKG